MPDLKYKTPNGKIVSEKKSICTVLWNLVDDLTAERYVLTRFHISEPFVLIKRDGERQIQHKALPWRFL